MIKHTFRWVKTPPGPLKLSVYLLPLLPQLTKELVYAGTSSTMSIKVYLRWAKADGVIFNSVPLDSVQRASNLGPRSCSWQPHHTTVGFLPSTGKSRTRPEPGCHDPNPQLTQCSATGREVCWHGKHSLGHKWSQRISPGPEPMLLNIPQNQRFPFFPFSLPGLFVLPELKPGIDLSADIFQIAKLKQQLMEENVHIWVLMRCVCKKFQQWLKLHCIQTKRKAQTTLLLFFVHCRFLPYVILK